MKKQINLQSKLSKPVFFYWILKNFVKITFFLSIFITIDKSVIAQETECKYSVNEFDKFTKKKVLQTKWKRITAAIALDGKNLEVCAKKVDTDAVLLFDFSVTHSVTLKGGVTKEDMENQRRWIPNGYELIILLDDESTLTLNTNEDFKSRLTYTEGSKTFNNISYNFNNKMEIKYPLTDEQVSILSSKGATSIRLYFETSEGKKESFDCEFGKKRLNSLKEVVDCIK